MKYLTFESIRRFMSGGRKKDRNECSFKRSDSFKRISIRKNYLDRGGKGRNPLSAKLLLRKHGHLSDEDDLSKEKRELAATDSVVIDYGEWIRGMQTEDKTSLNCKKTISSSYTYLNSQSHESSLEINKTQRASPLPNKHLPSSSSLTSKVSVDIEDNKTDSAISVSLGRIWMDAPRSLELPRQPCVVEKFGESRRAHHSLDSALKEKKEEREEAIENNDWKLPNLFSQSPRPAVIRSVSSTSQLSYNQISSTRSSAELLTSSKDSGFSFSISIPRLSPVLQKSCGAFSRKINTKPVSVKKQKSFKKQCASRVGTDCKRTPSYCNKNNRLRRTRKKTQQDSGYGDMYQVVINRPQRSAAALKLDPIIFVPPEKRKSLTVRRTYDVREIRDYCLPYDAQKPDVCDNEDKNDEDVLFTRDKLYDVIVEENYSDEILLHQNFNDCPENRPLSSSNSLSSEIDDEIYDYSSTARNDPPLYSNSPYKHVENVMIGNEKEIEKSHDNDVLYAKISSKQGNGCISSTIITTGEGKIVSRKKSGRNNCRYIAKRTVYRAPSTLKRNRRIVRRVTSTGDITQKGYEKKRGRLLASYLSRQQHPARSASTPPHASKTSPVTSSLSPTSTAAVAGCSSSSMMAGCSENQQHQHHHHQRSQHRFSPKNPVKLQRKLTSDESRYHSVQTTRKEIGPLCNGDASGNSAPNVASPNTRSRRRGNRRFTRNETRYHSEVRQEAVQQALAALHTQSKGPPMPSKRTSVMARSPERRNHETDSSSGDESGPDNDAIIERDRLRQRQGRYYQPPRPEPANPPPIANKSNDQPPALPYRPPQLPKLSRPQNTCTNMANINRSNDEPPKLPPPRTSRIDTVSSRVDTVSPPVSSVRNSNFGNNATTHTRPTRRTSTTAAVDRVTNRFSLSRHSLDDGTTTSRHKVSAKIQQLLDTLKKPKRRPLLEFYEDDDIELELAANTRDPSAPRPEGGLMEPVIGGPLIVPSGLPRTLEAAIERYGSGSFKAMVATVLGTNGKQTTSLTYGKLLSRSHKVAYTLLNKGWGGKGGETCVKSSERVALVYPNSDPLNFLCAFYGCIFAGVVPVPIEVPLTRRDAGSQQVGFLLGSCNVQIALTSEACFKGLPKSNSGDITAFRGWPKLHWVITEHLPRPPKDWSPPARLTDDTPAYIQYTTDGDGSVMGVTTTRAAMLAHSQTLTQVCNYTEGEVMICVLDFKRETGLWHAVVASILNGMHVVFIPYSLMKVNPASWMQMVTKYKASVAVVKSRDLHWGLLATKDHKDVSFSSLRLLLIGDGANPWSLSSCDQFLSVFSSKGLKADTMCPCASSNECLSVSIRRPGRAGANSTGRGVLSMSGLSYGVVRVDQENSLTSLTLQDCGHVLPDSTIVVLKLDGSGRLAKTDEVGEIYVSSKGTASQYWGLPGLSHSTFKVKPVIDDNNTTSKQEFTRSGLLGFLGPGGLVFICGSREGLMTVSGRKHNADDIIATVLAVEPMKFIYRGRITVFSIRVLRDERICVIAEQRPECSEEESFQWMSRVIQAVDSIHQVGLYCLVLVPANHLPKTPLGGIHQSECKRKFLQGNIHPANVLMCPHTCVTNLPKPRELHAAGTPVTDVGPASVMVGNIVQGNRLASAQGRDIGVLDDEHDGVKKFITDILKWRAVTNSDHNIFTLLNAKGSVAGSLTCSQLHKRAERVGCHLIEKGKVNTGDHVALIFPPGLDLICAFYGCLYVGAIPITIRPPNPTSLQTTLPTVRMTVDVSKSVLVLTNQTVIKMLKSKEANSVIDLKSWPVILDTDDSPKKKLNAIYRAPTTEMIAYIDFSVSTTGMLAGIKISHGAVTSLCRSMKLACELYPSRHIAVCLDPYSGLGFALWVLSSVYSGYNTILVPPSEVEINASVWLSALSQYSIRDTFCSYGVMDLCTKGLGSSVGTLKQRGVNLACVRTCVVIAEERPRINLINNFSKLFSTIGLTPRAVSTSFGCRVNIGICLQGASSPEPCSVYIDLRALRNDRITLVERGSPHSLCLLESGKLLPGVKVIIANPETNGQCGDSHLGEIWVQSPHTSSGYFTVYGDEQDVSEHFNGRLVTGNTNEVYAKTGYLGFVRRAETISSISNDAVVSLSGDMPFQPRVTNSSESTEMHDAVFVVGSLDETIVLRGMRYHPTDIENCVMRAHKKIAECAVFSWTGLLVVVVELDGNENEALDLVPLVTNAVLEEHHLIVGVAVVVDPGVIPVNSRGEKQRMHLRDGFLSDYLDPIYVAYNM